jgi:hypothetical protein
VKQSVKNIAEKRQEGKAPCGNPYQSGVGPEDAADVPGHMIALSYRDILSGHVVFSGSGAYLFDT